jgi:hypothetical protein
VIFGNFFLKKYLHHSITETLKTGFTTMMHIIQPLKERIKSLKVGNSTST